MTELEIATLPDGRGLSYAIWGDPGGAPVFLFHGWPGSRLMGLPLNSLCGQRGVCLIAPDRPGFGRSDLQTGRRITDWPRDVAGLADAMGLDSFGVVGISNGGPYALACGAALSNRITSLAVVSGMGPAHTEEARQALAAQVQLTFGLNSLSPLASEAIVWILALGARLTPAIMASQMRLAAPPSDRAVLDRPDVLDALKAEYAEAFHQGASGLNAEIALMRADWGFALADVRLPVHLFHGEDDANVPVALAHQVVAALPDPHPRFLDDAAHYWYVDNFAEVLDALSYTSQGRHATAI